MSLGTGLMGVYGRRGTVSQGRGRKKNSHNPTAPSQHSPSIESRGGGVYKRGVPAGSEGVTSPCSGSRARGQCSRPSPDSSWAHSGSSPPLTRHGGEGGGKTSEVSDTTGFIQRFRATPLAVSGRWHSDTYLLSCAAACETPSSL